MHSLVLDGHSLSLAQIDAFLSAGADARVSVAPAAAERVRACAVFCEGLAQSETPHYGVNTGFGKFARTRIAPAEAGALQLNLVRSHATALGPALDDDLVRLIMMLRANSLVIGYSGVSMELVDLLLAMVNAGLAPAVPCYGSVGASGDLAPLAHIALALVGEGEGADGMPRTRRSQRRTEARKLRPKRLALIKHPVHVGVGGARCTAPLKTATAAALPSRLPGHRSRLRPRLHDLKGHPGQSRGGMQALGECGGGALDSTASRIRTRSAAFRRCWGRSRTPSRGWRPGSRARSTR
jgi:histidine ammonia-lyase